MHAFGTRARDMEHAEHDSWVAYTQDGAWKLTGNSRGAQDPVPLHNVGNAGVLGSVPMIRCTLHMS